MLFGLVLMALAGYLIISLSSLIYVGRSDLSKKVYAATGALCGGVFLISIWPRAVAIQTIDLPLGVPWIGMHLRIDTLSTFFLAVINLVSAAASIYAIGYGAHEKHPLRILPFFPLFIAAMNLVVLADDAFTFLWAWELMSVFSWALVLTHDYAAENRLAAYIYLLMASFGSLMLLMAFGLLGGAEGAYQFSSIRETSRDEWKAGIALVLVVFGVGSKAGLVPLHIWLPLTDPAAPSHVAALMSGVMKKVAIYGFIRIVFDLLGPPAYWWSIEPITLGAVSALVGVLFAIIQDELKKVLAYGTIENIGIIFIALGLALAFKANGMTAPAALAFTAALLHVLNHALFKAALFFGAGAIITATGEKTIERLGGLIKLMPKSAILFLIACLAIAALPPLNGFVSEWLLFQGILLTPALPQWGLRLLAPVAGIVFALSAALGAACYVRVYGISFLGRARSKSAEHAQEVDDWSLGAMLGLLVICLSIGLIPGLMIDAISPVAESVVGGRLPAQHFSQWLTIAPITELRSSYNGFLVALFVMISGLTAYWIVHRLWPRPVRYAPAWDCGYVDPTPLSQYSASSFAQPIRRALGGIAYTATEHLDMPKPGDMRAAKFGVEIKDRAMIYLYGPICASVLAASNGLNRFNYLKIQEYLAVVFAALILLLLVVAI
ncbi:MAG: hydrogenase 4 subunit B [Methylocystaceae bacterium]|nr:hydrogenase 4 subunit B [Methylocystaceae bacterium]